MTTPATEQAAQGGLFASYWRFRHLIVQLAARETAARYRGSLFGMAWTLLNPLIMLAIYTFVFVVVFKARWPGRAADMGSPEFAVIVFCGLILHGFLSDCLTHAPGQIVGNTSYVKKVVFPLEAIAWSHLGAALFQLLANFAILTVFQLFVFGWPPLTWLLFPLVLLPLVLFSQGLMWVLSALAVYVRDVGQMVGWFATVLLFLSPILYPLEAVPESMRVWLWLNPLTWVIEALRDVVLWGQVPSILVWVLMTLGSLLLCWAGLRVFQRARRGFADVL